MTPQVRCDRCGVVLDRPNSPDSDAYSSGLCQVCLNGPLLPPAYNVPRPSDAELTAEFTRLYEQVARWRRMWLALYDENQRLRGIS